MAQEVNSDSNSDSDSSSAPLGPPGGGALTFLPVQPSQNNNNNNNDNNDDNKSNNESDSDSDSTPIGIPGGGVNLSFIPVQNTNNNNNDSSSSPSSSSPSSSSNNSTPIGLPGGGLNPLSFVPVQTNDDNNNPSSSSSSCSSSPICGIPGGNNKLTFLPTNNGENNKNNDSSSSSSSDIDSSIIGLGGGVNKLSFLPRNNINNNNDNNDNNDNNMNMLSYDEDPEDSDEYNKYDNKYDDKYNKNKNKNNKKLGLNRIDSGVVDISNISLISNNILSSSRNSRVRSLRNVHAASYSDDETKYDDLSPSPPPRISAAKTMSKQHSRSRHKKTATIHRKIRSSTLAETKKEHNAVWDLVYMTSSPLVCVTDFGDNNNNNNKSVIALELLDVSRETEEFMSVLASFDRELCVVHEIATSGNLIRAMTHNCRILHYSGHGFPSYLAFEDPNSIGDTHMLRDAAFAKIISDNKNKSKNKKQLEFVFTSACHSEAVGRAFVSAGVPHVVSIDTKFEVSDEGAMTFTKYFYEALLCGRTIRDSFNFAKQSVEFISSSAKRDFEKFKLLPKKGKHDVALFKNLNKGHIINKTQAMPPNNLPTTISPFIGRSCDMRDIIHLFMSKKNENVRIINIYGDCGVGKSSISIMLCRYLNDRKIYFKNGIYYINSIKLIENQEGITLTEMINNVINAAFNEYNNKYNNNTSLTSMKWNNNTSINGDTQQLISSLKLFCRYGLFVIDDIDKLILYYKANDIDINKELFNVLFKILICVSEKIKFIIISRKICAEIYKYNRNSSLSPSTFKLKRLSSTDSSNLFAKLTSGTWRPNDIKENIDIMSILKNNPLQIHELAKLKNQWECKTLTKLVEIYNFKNKLEKKSANIQISTISATNQRKQTREQLIKQYISCPSAQIVWRKAHGMELCDYHKIFDILKYEFTEFTFSKRKLEQNNLIQCFRILGMNLDLTINIEKFDNLYLWFNGLIRLVQILNDYYNRINPIIIHGFVSRDDAQNMLLNNENIPIGTFIIRFRYKQPKSIAISYKQNINIISNLKCDLSQNNDSTFICGKKLLSLNQFILSFHPLKYLYHPKAVIPKHQIFASSNSSNQPSWNNNTKSWNPPNQNNNNNNNNNQPSMIHAPTQNPYIHQQQQQQQRNIHYSPPSHHHHHQHHHQQHANFNNISQSLHPTHHHQHHQQQQQQQHHHHHHNNNQQYKNENNNPSLLQQSKSYNIPPSQTQKTHY